MKQAILDIGVKSKPNFDNFVCQAGDNSLAFGHLQACLEGAVASNTLPSLPCYLWGAAGGGKSHLLHAAYSNLHSMGMAVGWMDSDTEDAGAYDSTWTAIILDDVHRYSAAQQQAAFNWFVNAQTEQRWVLAAGGLAPAQLDLREDLRTRLGWGHVFELKVLNETQRRQVLNVVAAERGLVLKDEVLEYILTRFSRDLSVLMGLLDSLDRLSLREQRPITIPLVRQMMEE